MTQGKVYQFQRLLDRYEFEYAVVRLVEHEDDITHVMVHGLNIASGTISWLRVSYKARTELRVSPSWTEQYQATQYEVSLTSVTDGMKKRIVHAFNVAESTGGNKNVSRSVASAARYAYNLSDFQWSCPMGQEAFATCAAVLLSEKELDRKMYPATA